MIHTYSTAQHSTDLLMHNRTMARIHWQTDERTGRQAGDTRAMVCLASIVKQYSSKSLFLFTVFYYYYFCSLCHNFFLVCLCLCWYFVVRSSVFCRRYLLQRKCKRTKKLRSKRRKKTHADCYSWCTCLSLSPHILFGLSSNIIKTIWCITVSMNIFSFFLSFINHILNCLWFSGVYELLKIWIIICVACERVCVFVSVFFISLVCWNDILISCVFVFVFVLNERMNQMKMINSPNFTQNKMLK